MGLKAISRLIKGAPDYESGIWTPTLGATSADGSHTYSQNEGHYARVGNIVWLAATVAVTTLDGAMSGNVAIKGLPFTSSLSGVGVAFTVSRAVGVNIDAAGGYTTVTATLKAGNNEVALREEGDNTAFSDLTQAAFTNGAQVIVAGTYLTS